MLPAKAGSSWPGQPTQVTAESPGGGSHRGRTQLYYTAALDKPHLLIFPIKETAPLLSYGV